ncbi:MAG TPA: hypothetical protein VIT44_02390 [Cyclobacteriaceae bacterium]
MENELICDKILRKFEGNKSFSWEQVHEKSFYESVSPDYFVVENHIKFLIGDNALHETGTSPTYLSLTPKGWFIMTDSSKFGYVAKRQAELTKENREKSTLTWAKWATIVAIISVIIWAVDKILSNCSPK